MRWQDAIDEYFCDQQAQGRINSPETVRSYRRVLNLHAQDTATGPLDASRHDVKRTLARWEHPNTRAREHAVLVGFYDWVSRETDRSDNPARQVARPKMRKASVQRLTRSEVDAMIAACQTTRERRVILLGARAGARAGEMMGFQGRHFKREGFIWVSADIAKGKRERWVPVLDELIPIVRDIRAEVDHDHFVITTFRAGGIVPCPPTQGISITTLARLVRKIAERAGVAGHVHPHLLRHAFGDHIARRAGLHIAQALMGHASVRTTEGYVGKPDLDELAAAVKGTEHESIARRQRFERQMHATANSTLDMGGREMLQWVLAR